MAADQVLHDVPYDHQLFRRGTQLLLSVVCGRSEVFTVTVPLNATEAARYETQGVSYVASLAMRIQGDPDAYAQRAL